MTHFIRSAIRLLLAAGGGALLVILVAQVVLRYVFQSPIFGAEELARALALWVYFIAGAYALATNAHICADIRDLIKIPDRMGAWVDVVIRLVILAASVLLAWLCTEYAWWVYKSEELTPGLWWPRYLLVSAAAVGSVAMSCIAVVQLIHQINELVRNKQRRPSWR